MSIVANASIAALSSAFKPVILLLSTIFKIAKEIRAIVERVKANKHQFLRLSERINMIVGYLQGKQFDETLSEPNKAALISFASFLYKCREFMNTYTSAGAFKLLWKNKDYLHQFTELHAELSQYAADFYLGTQLTSMLANKNQHENDYQPISANISQQTNTTESALGLTVTHDTVADNDDQEKNIFKSGIWQYRRCSNKVWQNPYHCELIFNMETETLTGFGEDNFGSFKVNGPFDQHIRLIEMTWSYKDHLQIIQLQWVKDRNLLCGLSYAKKTVTDQVCRCMGQFEMTIFTPLQK